VHEAEQFFFCPVQININGVTGKNGATNAARRRSDELMARSNRFHLQKESMFATTEGKNPCQLGGVGERAAGEIGNCVGKVRDGRTVRDAVDKDLENTDEAAAGIRAQTNDLSHLASLPPELPPFPGLQNMTSFLIKLFRAINKLEHTFSLVV
jgi:hypothetical protein